MAALAGAVLPEAAGAQCRNVWAPSPEGGQLILVCDGNTGSAGSGGGRGKAKKKKPRKPPPQFGAITLNPVPVEGVYSGATSAGYATKRKARNRALTRCAWETGGPCKVMATVRNGWAVLVAAGGPGGPPLFFSGTARQRAAAQSRAEARAEQALGANRTGPTLLVVGVDSRARKRR